MKEKLKMLQVKNSTHDRAKMQALKKGISIKDYIMNLVNNDIEKDNR